jgi:copper chaperone
MTNSTYTVKGMTCGHCVQSVVDEINRLPGVAGVDVDLGSGRVNVRSHTPVQDAKIRDAVREAGYEVVNSP